MRSERAILLTNKYKDQYCTEKGERGAMMGYGNHFLVLSKGELFGCLRGRVDFCFIDKDFLSEISDDEKKALMGLFPYDRVFEVDLNNICHSFFINGDDSE